MAWGTGDALVMCSASRALWMTRRQGLGCYNALQKDRAVWEG